jgi:hypothetical protein
MKRRGFATNFRNNLKRINAKTPPRQFKIMQRKKNCKLLETHTVRAGFSQHRHNSIKELTVKPRCRKEPRSIINLSQLAHETSKFRNKLSLQFKANKCENPT